MSPLQPYKTFYIDISGKCNARCPWCDRGARKLGFLPTPLANTAPTFMPVDVFGEILDHLLSNNIISKDASLALHNWGEPLIHPQIYEIFSTIKKNKLYQGGISFSTNGSRCIELDPDAMPKIISAEFSLPGFSQASYDFAHKFNFEKTIANIFRMSKDLSRFKNTMKLLLYHVYKHNLTEIRPAQSFNRKLNFTFFPTLAFFNSLSFASDYHDNIMSTETLDRANKSLFLYDYDDLKYLRPKDFVCSQFSVLTISHDAQLNIGCCSRLDSSSDCLLGDIRSLSLEDIVAIRKSSLVCQTCIAKNLDFSIEYSISWRRNFCASLVARWL